MSNGFVHRQLPTRIAEVALAWTAVALMLLAHAGCALVELRRQSDEFYASTVLVGRVSAASSWSGPVVVWPALRTTRARR